MVNLLFNDHLERKGGHDRRSGLSRLSAALEELGAGYSPPLLSSRISSTLRSRRGRSGEKDSDIFLAKVLARSFVDDFLSYITELLTEFIFFLIIIMGG